MQSILLLVCKLSNFYTLFLNWWADLVLLSIRFYIARILLWSGWLKLQSWDGTLALFENDYKVPLLSPVSAAYLGTFVEIFFPILLLIGLGARIPATVLFIFNLVMAYSYPILFTEEFACALKDHVIWGILLGIIVFWGHGKWSVDHLLKRKICKEYTY